MTHLQIMNLYAVLLKKTSTQELFGHVVGYLTAISLSQDLVTNQLLSGVH